MLSKRGSNASSSRRAAGSRRHFEKEATSEGATYLRTSRYAIASLAVFSSLGVVAPAQDYLEPEETVLNAANFQWEYADKLRSVLLKDAARYYLARLIVIPSFEPEWVVNVFRVDKGLLTPDDQLTYFVEYARAEKQLWYRKNFRDVKVKRARVQLDEETANAVAEVWRPMLKAMRYPESPEVGATDGVTFHFSRAVRVPRIDRGRWDERAGFEQGRIHSPSRDSLTGDLTALGGLLKEYAVAHPEFRDKLRSDIRARAEKLKTKVNGARP
jgi:hypothetical protein